MRLVCIIKLNKTLTPMKKLYFLSFLMLLSTASILAQQVTFEEYELSNGLHVILHQDNSAPVVATTITYHVGSKDEDPSRTGMAHFFEHLLFEGSKNIKRGEYSKIISSNGGRDNATTNQDRTYYYEFFPSNNLELGLWLESERLLHPVIDQKGVDVQNEAVKEEKRLRMDNSPYGRWAPAVFSNLFKNHPYKWMPIGSMDHLDATTLEDFLAFNKKYYVPNNATLVVAGDFETEQAKKLIAAYFETIPKGADIPRINIKEEPITEEINAVEYDPNIQIPAVFTAYRTPSMKTREARVLDMISSILSSGKSSRLYKKLVDDKKKSLQVAAFNYSLEDYGAYIILSLPLGETTLTDLVDEMDEEVVKLQTELISEKEYQKLQNKFENQFVNSNASIEGIAGSLANYKVLYGDTNLINTEIDIYRSITREEIRDVAKKYLNKNQRLVLEYLPKKEN